MKKSISFSLVLGFAWIILSQSIFAQPIFRGESTEYDYTGKRWFTSDDGTSIVQLDSNGVTSYFGTNAKATHGMEILGNTLFTCVGTKIYGYDLTTELEVMQVTVPGATFLNGLTNNGVDKLYATCFTTKKIYEIEVSSLTSPIVTEIVSATGSTPNGIVYDSLHQRLIFVSWGLNAPIKAVDLNGFAISTLTTSTFGNIDGIDDDGLGHYYLSCYSPIRIIRYDTSFSGPAISVGGPGLYNPSDICYAKGIDILGIPNGNGPVTFQYFGELVGMMETNALNAPPTIFPNPVTEQSYLQFQIEQTAQVEVRILDIKGREVNILLNETMPTGKHFILFSGLNLSKGVYFAQIQSAGNNLNTTLKFLVK